MVLKRERKNFILRILYDQKFLALAGLLIIILISFPLAKNTSKRYNIAKEVRELEGEINELDLKNKDLRQLITYLESDQFVEEQARLNLGLKKQNEKVVVIKESEVAFSRETLPANRAARVPGYDNFSNPRKWWNYFFN